MMDIYYCPVCGLRLSEDDVRSGRAIITKEKRALCKKCYDGFSESAGATKESHPPQTNQARPARTRPTDPEPTNHSQLIILGIFAALLVGVLLFFLLMDKPKSNVADRKPIVETPTQNPQPKPPEPIPTPVDLDKQAEDALSTALNAPKRIEALEEFLTKYPDTRVSGRARDELRKAKIQQDADKGVFVLASTHPGVDSWSFINGDEFGPSTGSIERQGDGSAQKPYALKLNGDFSKGGGYVSAAVKFNSGVMGVLSKTDFSRVASLRFQLRTTDIKVVTLRISDDTGQALLYRRGITPQDTWQTVEFKKLSGIMEHWGGANDGKIHWPIKTFTILLERGNMVTQTPTASLQITQLELVLNP